MSGQVKRESDVDFKPSRRLNFIPETILHYFLPHGEVRHQQTRLSMSSLLARLGQSQARSSAYTLRINGSRTTPHDPVLVECRVCVRPTLSQSRSYGGDPGAFRTWTRKRRKRTEPTPSLQHPRQRREIHGYRGTATATTRAAAREYTPIVRSPQVEAHPPPYPAQDSRPSGRAEPAARDPSNVRPLGYLDHYELWEHFERDDHEQDGSNASNEARNNASVDISRPIEGNKMLGIDYESELPNALLKSEPDRVVRCLFAALYVNDREFIRNIPVTTFSEIIRVLEPRLTLSPLASAHLELSAAMTRQLGIAPMREVAYEYVSVLREILKLRRGGRLTLSDYKALLRGARDLGNQKFALKLWNDIWVDGHTPDAKCYNLYMSSAVWNGVHSAGARQKVRVIDFNMTARKKTQPKNNFRQYRIGAGGLRETAMSIFNEMLAADVVANEESFRILITAAAREGDVAMMKSILKKVWNVDAEAILAGEDEHTIKPKSLPTHSPLYPTPQLLFAIAHAFGINNDIPSALRVVDFVARHYQVPIVRAVWDQLFEWTFVLALERHGTDMNTGSEVGQLPPESAMSLWNTMTSAPYSIEPTIGMYNALIRNLFQRGKIALMTEKMREGRILYYKHRKHAQNIWFTLQHALRGEHDRSRGSVEQIRHEYEAADLRRKTDLFWLKRWLRLLLASYRDAHRGEKVFTSEVPRMLWEWRDSASTVVKYEVPTGFVEFKIRTGEEIESFAREQFRHKSRRREELREAERYIGEKWVKREVRPAKRLLAKA